MGSSEHGVQYKFVPNDILRLKADVSVNLVNVSFPGISMSKYNFSEYIYLVCLG